MNKKYPIRRIDIKLAEIIERRGKLFGLNKRAASEDIAFIFTKVSQQLKKDLAIVPIKNKKELDLNIKLIRLK